MALPTCECVKGLPIGEQLAAIYCATYTLAAGDVDGPYLLKSANLSDVDNPDVSRGNINAAESGANTDITSLGGVLDIAAGGATPSAATYPKVIARAAVDQTLNVGSETTLIFGTEILDTAGIYNPVTGETTIPATAAGTYLVGFGGIWMANGSADAVVFYVVVNGSNAGYLLRVESSSSPFINSASTEVQLSAGDVVTVRAFQNSGTAWDVIAGPTISRHFVTRLF